MRDRSFPPPLGRQSTSLSPASDAATTTAPLVIPAALLVVTIVLPLAALLWRALTSPDFWLSWTTPLVLQALRVTLVTTSLTLTCVLLVGTPLAYLLARRRFRGKWLVDLVIDLPLVLPPVVAGVALLMAFGRRGLLGPPLQWFGIELPFTTAAVVLAQLFVAGPFYVRSARVGFAAIDPAIEEAAAIDGASGWANFRLITLPLALPGVASGIVLCLGRALSEFGATLLFAGNFAGQTQTLALAIVQAMESDLNAALALSVLLIALATLLLSCLRWLARGRAHD
jgi:molybdate transport system permease protein